MTFDLLFGFLRYLVRAGFVRRSCLPDFRKPRAVETDTVFLNDAEINTIRQLDLSRQPLPEYVRNLFLIGCATGLRFSDLSKINKSDVDGAMLIRHHQKTCSRVVIPLKPSTITLLDAYLSSSYRVLSNQKFNQTIRQVAALAMIDTPVTCKLNRSDQVIEETRPKFAWITSHTCRRSYCTNEFLKGTPNELIQYSSGHLTAYELKRYIRATPLQVAELFKSYL